MICPMKLSRRPLSEAQQNLADYARDCAAWEQKIVNACHDDSGTYMVGLRDQNQGNAFIPPSLIYDLCEEHEIQTTGIEKKAGAYHETSVATIDDLYKAKRLIDVALRAAHDSVFNPEKWDCAERISDSKNKIEGGCVWYMAINREESLPIMDFLKEYDIDDTRMISKESKVGSPTYYIEVGPQSEEKFSNILREHAFSPDDLPPGTKDIIFEDKNWTCQQHNLSVETVKRMRVIEGRLQAEQMRLFLSDYAIRAKVVFEKHKASPKRWYVEIQPGSVGDFMALCSSHEGQKSKSGFVF